MKPWITGRIARGVMLVTFWSAAFGPALAAVPGSVLGQVPLSPAALAASADGRILYIACATAERVLVFDTMAARVVQEIAVPGSPSGMALAPDQRRLYVTCAAAASTICVVDTASGEVVQRMKGGHTTLAPVLSPCGGVLYVCHRFEDRVAALEVATGRELWTVGVEREPIAAALRPGGRTLVVANHLNKGRADEGLIGVKVSLVDVETGAVTGVIQLPRGSGLARGVAISPDGKFAAVTHLLARYYLPTSDVAFGRINGNVVSLIDLEQSKWMRNVYLDTSGRGAANPWAVAWTADGKSIVVTHAGAHKLSVLDAPVLPQKPAQIRVQITLPGNGPRAVAVAGSRVFVGFYFSDSIAEVDLGAPDAEIEAVELAPHQEPPQVRRGEAYFNDGSLCAQSWQSCASCHDSDGRADGLNWDLLNDGLGNPKNARSLVWAHQTPPAMSLGVRAGARVAVRAGLKHILFAEQPEHVANAIDAYLQELAPAPSPALVEGQLSLAAARGQVLFADPEVGCARCHPAPLFTDLKQHQVGTGGRYDRAEDRFDTPALVELWRTAPYLHDGSAATLQDVLTTRNPQDQHGRTSHLSPQAIDDLAEYLRSL